MRVATAAALLALLATTALPQSAESPFKPVGTITYEPVNEMSGIAKSNTHDDVYWVLNDSGDTARLFAVNGRGEVIQPVFWDEEKPYPGVEILLAANLDWEDLTIDGDTLYVADVGNNGNARRDLGVYVIKEPNPRKVTRTRPLAFLPIRYPEQKEYPGNLWHFDCEAVFVSEGKLYFVTKHRVPGVFNSGEWGARLYRLDTRYTDRENVLALVDSRPDLALPTAAEVSPDGTKLALLTAFSLHVLEKPVEGDAWLSGKERVISLDRKITKQAEAVCWDDDETIRVTNEQRELYTVSLNAIGKPPAGPVATETGTVSIPKFQERIRLRFSPTGSHLLIAHRYFNGKKVRGWNGFNLLPTGDPSKAREFTLESTGTAMPVFSRNGRFLAFGVPAGPERMKVHLVDLGGGEDAEHDVPHRSGLTMPAVAAVSDDGGMVAVEEPQGPDRRGSLLVYSLSASKTVARLPDYREPLSGPSFPGAVLAGGCVFYHMNPAGKSGRNDLRLVVQHLDGTQLKALPGWVSTHTSGHVVSRNGRWVLSGGRDYDITRTWFDGREDDLLFKCREQLDSHRLELTSSANEWMIIAWSYARPVLCCCDSVKEEHFNLNLGKKGGGTLLGLSPHGRYAYVTGGPEETRAITVFDLWRRIAVGKLLDIPNARVVLDPTGRFLATLVEDGEEWKLKFHRLR